MIISNLLALYLVCFSDNYVTKFSKYGFVFHIHIINTTDTNSAIGKFGQFLGVITAGNGILDAGIAGFL